MKSSVRRSRWLRLVSATLIVLALPTSAIAAARANTICTGDVCVITGGTVSTPVGPATVTVTPGNVVTVVLGPTVQPLVVLAVPFAFPPGPPCLPTYCRTTITTTAGTINIDTIVIPVGALTRFALPNVAVISIHPPGPCRVRTSGDTAIFTPINASATH